MALPEKPFEGKDFFESIRAEMVKNRGMFAGVDGVRHYACMDASFYRLKIFKKSGDVKFTAAAIADAPASARVVVNGQWFDTDYCSQPCSNIPWHGEIFVDGDKEELKPEVKFGEDKWYFGQFVGRSQKAFEIGTDYPSKRTPTIRDGLFPLNGIVDGNKTPWLGELVSQWNFVGRVVYGIHRKSDIVFVLVQENYSPLRGLDVVELSELLIDMGVDDAVMGDGGSSVTLLVDKNIEVQPNEEKDNTCRVGPMFLLQELDTEVSESTLTATAASSEPKFPAGRILNNVAAQFAQSNAGIELTIVSFGTSSAISQADIFATLGPPVVLSCASSRLTVPMGGAPLQFSGNGASAWMVFVAAKDSGGHLTGSITINTMAGRKAVFDLDWTLVP